MKKKIILHAAAYLLLIAGGVAVCTFLLSTAYDAGVRSALSSRAVGAEAVHNASAAPSRASSHASSAPKAPSSAVSAAPAAAQGIQEHDLVLVGPGHPMPSWYHADLADVSSVKMDRDVIQPFTNMKTDASKNSISLWISSAYRDDALQSSLFEREVEQYAKTCPTYSEAEAAAEKSVAKPGCSEHATGLAVDLNGVEDNFDGTPAFRWLQSHAQDYGFILRYPKDKQDITKIKYEPWHFRYVGVEAAKAMKQSGQCLEEYEASKTAAPH